MRGNIWLRAINSSEKEDVNHVLKLRFESAMKLIILLRVLKGKDFDFACKEGCFLLYGRNTLKGSYWYY
jgi:hypothetical protein